MIRSALHNHPNFSDKVKNIFSWFIMIFSDFYLCPILHRASQSFPEPPEHKVAFPDVDGQSLVQSGVKAIACPSSCFWYYFYTTQSGNLVSELQISLPILSYAQDSLALYPRLPHGALLPKQSFSIDTVVSFKSCLNSAMLIMFWWHQTLGLRALIVKRCRSLCSCQNLSVTICLYR